MAEAGDKVWKRQPCWGSEAEENDRGDYQRDADESHRGVSLSVSLPLFLFLCVYVFAAVGYGIDEVSNNLGSVVVSRHK